MSGVLCRALYPITSELSSPLRSTDSHKLLFENADWLITGEGRSDTQTLHGKAPFVAARHARSFGVDSTILSGAIDQQALTALQQHFTGCFSIVLGPVSLAQAIAEADQLLQAA